MKKLKYLAFLLYAVFFAQVSFAQFDYSSPAATNAVMQYNNMVGLSNIRNMTTTFDRINDNRKPGTSLAKKSTFTKNSSAVNITPSTASLKVAHDAEISREVREEFIKHMTNTNGKSEAEKADNFFGDIQTTFGKMIAPYGLHQDNYADVMAAYMVVMWMSVNKETRLPSSGQMQAVKNQVLKMWPNLDSKLDDKQRQIVAEKFMYQTCAAVVMRQNAVKGSNMQLLTQLSEQTSKNLLSQGINLNGLALTNNGFLRK